MAPNLRFYSGYAYTNQSQDVAFFLTKTAWLRGTYADLPTYIPLGL